MSLFRLRLQNAPTELSLLLYHLSYLSMALVTLSGALFPRGMLIDLVYNLGTVASPTPTPRRLSYGISTVWLAVSVVSFSYGLPLWEFLFGALVAIGGAILTTTLWCLGSWIYRLFWRAAGK